MLNPSIHNDEWQWPPKVIIARGRSIAEQTIEPKLNLPYRDADTQLCFQTKYYARLIWSLCGKDRIGDVVRIGILSDTHNQLERTRYAVDLLRSQGADLLIHCGDLIGPEILEECAVLPLYFTFGNHDCDMVRILEEAAANQNAKCLRWGGEFQLANKRIAVVHGHLTMDLRPLLDAQPDYLLSGHSHIAGDCRAGNTRRINPGSLFDAEVLSVAILDLATDDLRFITIPT